MGERPPLLAVVGATGTGKSEVAIALAERLDGEVVNTDALQFYRGMDVGTAKLPLEERRGIPHHLLDVLDVRQEASVAAFQASVRRVIADIEARGKRPVLVGGSGLYVRAALDVLEFPPTDPAVRADIEAELAGLDDAAVLERVRHVDPVSAARLNDRRRMIRALEVHRLTGRAFASFMPRREYLRPTLQIGLRWERARLNERLRSRVESMAARGLLAEVEALAARGLREGPTASKAIGYAQFLRVLDGEADEAWAVEDTAVATRRFAKRQVTWFGADPRVAWLDAEAPGASERAVAFAETAVD